MVTRVLKYGIINTERLAMQVFGLLPLLFHSTVFIDGFAKMPLPASFFASW